MGLKQMIERQERLALGMKCSCCGEPCTPADPSWRFNGKKWEHSCPGSTQCGHFEAVPIAPVTVYFFTDKGCGQSIMMSQAPEIMEWLMESMANMDAKYQNRTEFTIECVEMSQEQIDAMPEFDGC